jgi:hypothetical protein
MTTNDWTYLVYIALSIAATVWIGRTLRLRGRAFLTLHYRDETTLADPMSDLLALGFYTLHVGVAMLLLRFGGGADNLTDSIEVLSTKTGVILFILAASHFAHLCVFSKMRRSATGEDHAPRGIEPMEATMVGEAVNVS